MQPTRHNVAVLCQTQGRVTSLHGALLSAPLRRQTQVHAVLADPRSSYGDSFH